jgi:hypothetical protein
LESGVVAYQHLPALRRMFQQFEGSSWSFGPLVREDALADQQ